MAVLTSTELDEQIENERCEIRRLKQLITDYQSDVKFHKEKLHGDEPVQLLLVELHVRLVVGDQLLEPSDLAALVFDLLIQLGACQDSHHRPHNFRSLWACLAATRYSRAVLTMQAEAIRCSSPSSLGHAASTLILPFTRTTRNSTRT